MPARVGVVKAKHSGFFPLDPMGETRRPGSKKRTSLTGAPQTRKAARAVFENAFHSLKEISQKSGVSENFLRVSFKRWFGFSFTEYQKVARKSFIEKNLNRPNAWLCDQLGITSTTLSYLIRELKAEEKIAAKNRVKLGRSNAIPFEYSPMALEMMRLFVWCPIAISSPEMRHITQRSKNNITETINDLVKHRFIRRVKKEGQRAYYTTTPAGNAWLRTMERIRQRKDAEMEKDVRAVPGIIQRREAEKDKLLNFLSFVKSKDLIRSETRLAVTLRQKLAENERAIFRLRKLLPQKN